MAIVIDIFTRREIAAPKGSFVEFMNRRVGQKWYVVHARCKASRSTQGVPFPRHAALLTRKEYAALEAEYAAL